MKNSVVALAAVVCSLFAQSNAFAFACKGKSHAVCVSTVGCVWVGGWCADARNQTLSTLLAKVDAKDFVKSNKAAKPAVNPVVVR